jgi:Tfp pilus assembly protein PilV
MRNKETEGFTYVELLFATSLLLVSFLALAGMFVLAYAQVNGAGNTTMGLSGARQVLEDMRRLPYADLANLDGFDTEDPGTLPAGAAEREVARRWRYALAGEGVGWFFTTEEKARWPSLNNQGDTLSASGVIDVVSLTATTTQVTVTVSVPGRWRPVEVATIIADL